MSPMKCALIAGKLYPTMTMTAQPPSPKVCESGKGRGFESCLRCENGKK